MPLVYPMSSPLFRLCADCEWRKLQFSTAFLGLFHVAISNAALFPKDAWILGVVVRGAEPRGFRRRFGATPRKIHYQ